MADLAVGIIGAAGRMGRALVRAVVEAKGCRVAVATERPGHGALGQDAGVLAGIDPLGVVLTDDPEALFATAAAVLDFTVPAACAEHAAKAAVTGTIFVTGTTGLESAQQNAIDTAARRIAVVQAPNFSIGVNLVSALVEQTAKTLDETFDIEIVEMHHRHKADAPSGTALGLGRAAAKGRGVPLDEVSIRGRDGITGERRTGAIGFASLRGGDVIGDHTVMFAGPAERVEITHRAGGREIFARGAVRAAVWARDKAPGLYTMQDVLGFSR